MAIDPRRFRRRLTEQHVQTWKALTVAVAAVVAQAAPVVSHAQVQGPGNAGAPRDAWRFTPSIGLDETWSDNINLAPAGSARSDFVTTISPSLRLTRYGPRLTVNFVYNPQLLYYARGSYGSQLRNNLAAIANAALIENLLFFDARVSVTQTNVSPFGTLAADSVNGSANRAESRSYSLGPTLRSHFGKDLSYSAGYHYTGSSANNNAYAANHSTAAFAEIESGTTYADVGYGADVSRSDQTYGSAGQIVQETAGATLTYVLTPTIHLRGRLGYDRNSYPTTGQPDLKGPSYSGGFDWNPSQHTQFSAQVGHRYFGPTANISLRESTNRFSVAARYIRDQTTSSGAGLALVADPNYALLDQYFRASITDPALRAVAVTNALQQAGLSTSPFGTTNFLSNQLYLQKTAQLSLALLGLRNTVTLDATRSESQALSAITTGFDVFNQATKFRTTSYTANWSHKLGPRTSANFTASKIHNQAILGSGDTRQRRLTASVNRQIQRNLTGTVMVRNTTQSGANFGNGVNNLGGNFSSGSYRENAVLGSLRLTF